jgi:hypothetical protein
MVQGTAGQDVFVTINRIGSSGVAVAEYVTRNDQFGNRSNGSVPVSMLRTRPSVSRLTSRMGLSGFHCACVAGNAIAAIAAATTIREILFICGI